MEDKEHPKKKGLKDLMQEIESEKKKKKNKKKSEKGTKTKPDFLKNNMDYSQSDFKGLKNFGNSCYSNVVIQILTSIPEFLSTLSKRYNLNENENDLMIDYPILSRIMEIIENYKSKNTSLASNYLKEIVKKFDNSGNQNDAHEFLFFLLNSLNLELIKIETKYNLIKEEKKDNEDEEWEEVKQNGKTMKQTNSIKNFQTSILGNVFQGIIKQDIIQKGKSISNCQIEPFFSLHLDNDEKTIDLMFQKFFSKRNIEGNNDKSSQSFIEKLPEIFIVNVKGFFYDKKNKKVVKIKEPLIYEDKLTLKKEYFSPCLRNKDVVFELIGAIIHKGNLATEGHYICYCKDKQDGVWYYLDDNKVIKVAVDVVHQLRPYILFYRKC